MSDKEKHSTEAAIMKAAEHEFLVKGYDGARTTTIAKAAGVTHAMLHYYFRTKSHLFSRIVNEKFKLSRNILIKAIGDESLPLFDRVRQGVEQHFDFIAANPDLPRLIVGDAFINPEIQELIKAEFQQVLVGSLADLEKQINEYASRGLCRPIDGKMLLLDIVSLNIFPFLARPVINTIFGNTEDQRHNFLSLRKKENVNTILSKLKL